MSITAKELAKKLNLSGAAVSMALNNKPGVSPETRIKVCEAAQKYGYDFSKIKDKIELKKDYKLIYFIIFKRYGAVVSDTPFFSELTESIYENCRKANLTLRMRYVYDYDHFDQIIAELKGDECKGIVLLGTEISQPELNSFVNAQIPLVVLDTYFDTIACDYVLINNQQGVHLATQTLIRKYGNHIGYLASSYPIVNYQQRAKSFYNTIGEHGFSPKQILLHKLTPSLDGAYLDMRALLEAGEPIAKAYFADNDLIAYGAIKAFQDFGYKIPEDIGIIGFDDIPMCKYSNPPLSTIHVNIRVLTKLAIQRLQEIMNGDASYCTKSEVNTTFISRNSL